jgi:hypothetical protein
MSLEANLKDLDMHARDFNERTGFTYSVLDRDQVIGCVYIYPATEPGHDGLVRSWVRHSRSEMDVVVYRAVTKWIRESWPFESAQYAPRSST